VKGIAFNTIIFVLIAIVGVVILLMILNSIVPNFVGRPLCKLYQVVLSLPLPKQLKPTIPGCSIFPTMERITLDESLSNPSNLADYIEKCWEKSEEGKLGQTFICYELFMKKVNQPFNEGDITSKLKDENKIDWKIGIISGEELTVIIKYNSTSKVVEVI